MTSQNDPTSAYRNDVLRSLVASHGDLVRLHESGKFVVRKNLKKGKVKLISGGGSGHEPLHTGYVGFGMLDAACSGHVFTSPTPDQILEAIGYVGSEAGVLLIVKNYQGDVMNFSVARQSAVCEIETVVVSDDIASGPDQSSRRGIAGTVVIEKLLGAAAEAGADLAALKQLGKLANDNTRSIGVAFSSSTLPGFSKPLYEIEDGTFELGVGIHGERGVSREPLKSNSETVEKLVTSLVGELPQTKQVLLLINGLGSLSPAELDANFEVARRKLHREGIEVKRHLVGNYATSLDTKGYSITLTALDAELLDLWDRPVQTAALRWGI